MKTKYSKSTSPTANIPHSRSLPFLPEPLLTWLKQSTITAESGRFPARAVSQVHSGSGTRIEIFLDMDMLSSFPGLCSAPTPRSQSALTGFRVHKADEAAWRMGDHRASALGLRYFCGASTHRTADQPGHFRLPFQFNFLLSSPRMQGKANPLQSEFSALLSCARKPMN